VADFPLVLSSDLSKRLAAALDVEGKIPRALDALGPIAGRDVALVDWATGLVAGRLGTLGARVRRAGADGVRPYDLADGSADALVACWSAFRGIQPDELAEARRVLRPGGRLLVVHDYGRDDVSRLYPDADERPEYGAWSRRDGPFLGNGFKVRVVHCWWTFESVEIAQGFLGEAFGDPGRAFAAELRRPRLSYNVAVYHRSMGEPGGVGA
jgi:SAM-dependent methyltransferase